MYPVMTPNYTMTQDFSYNAAGGSGSGWGGSDYKIIPAGAFVRPIEPCYVPKHIVERWKSFDPKTDFYVYCSHGLIVVPKKLVRET